jgi:hypothetical protein
MSGLAGSPMACSVSCSAHSLRRCCLVSLQRPVRLRSVRANAFTRNGLSRKQIMRLTQQGALVRQGRGLYSRPDATVTENHTLTQFSYEGDRLCGAVAVTFAGRSLELPDTPPVGLSVLFAEDAGKKAQWRALVRQSGSPTAQALTLAKVFDFIGEFLLPILQAVLEGHAVSGVWRPETGWG